MWMQCAGCAEQQLVEDHAGRLVCTACGLVNPDSVHDRPSHSPRASKRARGVEQDMQHTGYQWTLDGERTPVHPRALRQVHLTDT